MGDIIYIYILFWKYGYRNFYFNIRDLFFKLFIYIYKGYFDDDFDFFVSL